MGLEVVIIGAGGHARTLINILELRGYKVNGIYDDNFKEDYRGEIIEGYSLLGGLDAMNGSEKVIIAKGNCQDLEKLSLQFDSQLLSDNLIHPSALVETEHIGSANQLSAMSYVSKSASIGSSNLIYSHTSIEHEVELGNFNVVTVNVSLCGRAKIGNGCFFGAGSVVLPNLTICDRVILGAGAVVTQDINNPGTYVGIPAKKLHR